MTKLVYLLIILFSYNITKPLILYYELCSQMSYKCISNKKSPINKKILKKLLKIKKHLNCTQLSTEDIINKLLEKYPYSSYGEYGLIIILYNTFINKGSIDELFLTLNKLISCYPCSKYLNWGRMLILHKLYYSINSQTYIDDANKIADCRRNILMINGYNLFLKKILFNLFMIYIEKEIYRIDLMTNRGEYITALRKYKELIINFITILREYYDITNNLLIQYPNIWYKNKIIPLNIRKYNNSLITNKVLKLLVFRLKVISKLLGISSLEIIKLRLTLYK